ncbi:enoyl-CoA hydratase-related protein [Roseicyclus persicicus]|uniref:Hydrogenase maturation protein n=1 Tax=Roseicyclus persicicus TaxID=2650661 RepID=A0A7X6H0Z6_9RHOB|nr:enoyl-CoA hydratase-related protein [Roseibacterium persicicum]NKX45965.1 hydrogenase maturation protein [Roseibacterium persicicum]
MRLLLLAHAFNSLTQRLWLELEADGHEVTLEYDINDAVTRAAVQMARPDLVIAPFLKRAIPEDVWRNVPCLIVHPGPLGDKGPSALDHAVQAGRPQWGVTVLQAVAEMDAGAVWATVNFPMRRAAKSSIYRREVTEAAVRALRSALNRWEGGLGRLSDANHGVEDAKPAMTQAARAVDWAAMDTTEVVARIRAADGQPGLRDASLGAEVWLHDAWPGEGRGTPGAVLGQRNEAVLRATRDGAVWIGAMTLRLPDGKRLKLPATRAMALRGLPLPPDTDAPGAPNGVSVTRHGDVALIRFPFLNGAMSVARSRALEAAIRQASASDARALLLTGGPEFWSNGIDLATIEAAASPPEESLAAIEAIDDVCLALLEARQWVVAGMQGNAGAGGVFLALCADRVIARDGVVLSPHYKNMGNLYGSEYWTHTLPRRLGPEGAARLMETRMPLLAREAVRIGLVDGTRKGTPEGVEAALLAELMAETAAPGFDARLAEKARTRPDAATLAAARAREIARMRLNFFGFDTSYHVARLNFIAGVPKSRTPLHLARHRQAPGRRAS